MTPTPPAPTPGELNGDRKEVLLNLFHTRSL